eukprot:CAMPEP_0113957274 /NCGR_PEP_ID=MMETSP0011_2-20120614/2673_1 /TAXON_ID=101924 /ORGANISM="Rhodosorus marinus" /LENGTH=366 /DNA_ID=CAMNT_0000967807 /DNA_START=260 /DNA_END=1360 /DNA_ORIENTATION=- /assembly_acc=CAM_ASM_000156
MIIEYEFRPAEKGVYTSAEDLFKAWLPYAADYAKLDTEHTPTQSQILAKNKYGVELFESFRASLGRVIRFCLLDAEEDDPPYCRELAEIKKHGSLYGFTSTKVRSTNLLADGQAFAKRQGRDLEKSSQTDPSVIELREKRRQRKLHERPTDNGDEMPMKVGWRYVDEFVADLICAPTLLELGVFPDGKELAESMATYAAVRAHMFRANPDDPEDVPRLRSDDKSITGIFVGDGSTPRTAALFAFRTSWTCISIDPAMKVKDMPWSDGNVARLEARRCRVEDTRIEVDGVAVVVLFHAHVSIQTAIQSIRAKAGIAVIACPCCNWASHQETYNDRLPDVEYEDEGIPSRKRLIRIWKVRRREHSEAQ